MEHEDGYCDRCGCEVENAQLTVTGEAICDDCMMAGGTIAERQATKPMARDDGR